MTGGPSDDGPALPPAAWSATLHSGAGTAERFGLVRLIPTIPAGEHWWQRGSLDDARAQLAAAAPLIAELEGDPMSRLVLAPAGWLRLPWPFDPPDPGLPPIAAESVASRHDAEPHLESLVGFLERELGESMARLSARYLCFGADFTRYGVDPASFSTDRFGWEVQGIFVYAPRSGRIRHVTTSFAGVGAWRSWLLASHRWETHFCRLDGVGSLLLLGGHDLASMAEARSSPKGHLKERRKAIRRLIDDKKPAALLHLAHLEEQPDATLADVDALIASAPAAAFKRAASVARWSGLGDALPAELQRLARGFRDQLVLLRP